MQFPQLSIHYKEILYGAYKSDAPDVYIKELLDAYTINEFQLRYLIKELHNRDTSPELMQVIKKEESDSDTIHGLPIGRFIYYATSMCHIWYTKTDQPFVYTLDPHYLGSIICYKDTGTPLPYIWLDICNGNKMNIVRCNVTHVEYLLVRLMWSARNDETIQFDLVSGLQYYARTNGNSTMIHINTHTSGYVSVECETGTSALWPYALIITHSNDNAKYQLSDVFCNGIDGRVERLLTSLHPI